MAGARPTVLFIGRSGKVVPTWTELRQDCGPGRTLRAGDAYRGMAALMQHQQLKLVVVNVDDMGQDEMAFFSTARRFRPDLQLLAIGAGNELSNPRLSEATRHGAQQAVNVERLAQILPGLLAQAARQTRPEQAQPEPAAPTIAKPSPLPLATETQAVPTANVPAGFQEARSKAQAKRKAPVRPEPKPKATSQGRDIITPEELRVLLGDEQLNADTERESKK